MFVYIDLNKLKAITLFLQYSYSDWLFLAWVMHARSKFEAKLILSKLINRKFQILFALSTCLVYLCQILKTLYCLCCFFENFSKKVVLSSLPRVYFLYTVMPRLWCLRLLMEAEELLNLSGVDAHKRGR